ncbi:MAG: hypothetical protein JXR97_13415, partial [Planctomycetes bacterium]|nr:hypothetical protein [Planctomycetota bacterium]
KRDVATTRNEPVPMNIRNAPTGLMEQMGYGKGYVYDHNAPDSFSGQQFLPDALDGSDYYEPGAFGFEKEIRKRLDYWAKLKQKRNDGGR